MRILILSSPYLSPHLFCIFIVFIFAIIKKKFANVNLPGRIILPRIVHPRARPIADFEILLSTFTIAVDGSGGRLRCLFELRITPIRSIAQRSAGSKKNILKTYIRAFGIGRSSLGLGFRLVLVATATYPPG